MRRRTFLAGAGTTGVASLAGCLGFGLESRSVRQPPLAAHRPNAVYVPTHVEGMKMVGVKRDGEYACGLAYTYPHRFWLVTGTRTEQVEIQDDDSVHLMPVVWERETGIVPPDLNPKLRIEQGGESVTTLSPWPMLSQPMGFHFGDNVSLPGDGTYQIQVDTGSPSTRRTGSLADNEGRASFSFEFEFAQSTLNEISFRDIPEDREGSEGAVPMMDMEMLPKTVAPTPEEMPGDVRATGTSGDAKFVVSVADAGDFGGEEGAAYLLVSPRTPHNRCVLPTMALSATLARDGEPVYDDVLTATLDPEAGTHYGAVVSEVREGDELTVTVDAPPQTARHEGYEMAFIDMPDLTFTL